MSVTDTIRKTPGDTAWFTHDRFGMFIHWGLYALPARHEWIKNIERITDEDYDKYFRYFNPDLYDAREWAKKAKAAGMKYAVLTSKHHEGFCLFDSQYTDYKATNTKIGRDLVKEFVEAFRSEGLKVGFTTLLSTGIIPISLLTESIPAVTTTTSRSKIRAGIWPVTGST